MAWFNKLFSANKENSQQEEKEESLNSLLFQMDKDRFQKEGGRNDFDSVNSAYSILAQINGLSHLRKNIYINEAGQKYIRTKLGFEPLGNYNYKLRHKQLLCKIPIKSVEINLSKLNIIKQEKYLTRINNLKERIILENDIALVTVKNNNQNNKA